MSILVRRNACFVPRDDTKLVSLRDGGGRTEDKDQVSETLTGPRPLEPVQPFVPGLLKGRRALVTGGNRGIGEAVTVALINAGAKVCVMAGDEQ